MDEIINRKESGMSFDRQLAYDNVRAHLEEESDCLVDVRYVAAKFKVAERAVRGWVRQWERHKKRTGVEIGIPRIRPNGSARCLRFLVRDVNKYCEELKGS